MSVTVCVCVPCVRDSVCTCVPCVRECDSVRVCALTSQRRLWPAPHLPLREPVLMVATACFRNKEPESGGGAAGCEGCTILELSDVACIVPQSDSGSLCCHQHV